MYRIGFTGSRSGMTQQQKAELADLIAARRRLYPNRTIWLHHGDCVGGDVEAHDIATSQAVTVCTHPPSSPTFRAYCKGADNRDPKPYLDRNQDIVDYVHELIAAPSGQERLRSGTWATIRYAQKTGRMVTIIWPDGALECSP